MEKKDSLQRLSNVGSRSVSVINNLPSSRGVVRHILEVVLIVGAYIVYEFIGKYGVPNVETVAFENAARVISWESSMGFFWEQKWQEWALQNFHAGIIFGNWMYTFGYWPVIFTIAIFLYVRDRTRYVYYRNIILVSFVLALIVFSILPTAPPRFLPPEFGFIDTLQIYGPSQYTARDSLIYYNLFAAMPSLHIGWTLLIGVMFLRSRVLIWLKALGIIYPVLTFIGIIITANHYIIDAAGGLGVMLAAYLLYEGFLRIKHRIPQLNIMQSPNIN